MNSSKVTVLFVVILTLAIASVMCAVVRDPYYGDYSEGFNSIAEIPRHRQFDHYGREQATRRRSDHHHHYHHHRNADTAFYFHRHGQAHFYPPIAVLGR